MATETQATAAIGAAAPEPTLDQEAVDFYRKAMQVLSAAEVPFLVGGAYAFARYTGVVRHTKDFDIFVDPDDFERGLAALEAAGFPVERNFPHWLGKVWCGEYYVDLIFSSGNGIARVDEVWFEHAVPETVLGTPVELVPVEEMIWSKAFIMERERFDGGDVAHLLRGSAGHLDWDRLLARFGEDWPVLYSHLVLFTYIYPGERDAIPRRLLAEFSRRLLADGEEPSEEPGEAADAKRDAERLCRGTVLSRSQYLIDVERWGYRDARLTPEGNMKEDEIEVWTEAAREEEAKRQQG